MSRVTKSRILFWMFISSAAMLLITALLFAFVFGQPSQPQMPEEMVVVTPVYLDMAQIPESTPIATTQPAVTPKPMIMQNSFKELYQQNGDIVGWIKVSNTDIDYPIMQSDNNEFYMEHDFYKEYSYPGSIFLDFRCDFNNMFEAAHQILYGHNMKNGTMFQQLTKYQNEDFFNENRYININTLYGDYIFEVFAAYETPVSFYYLETDFGSRNDWLEFTEVFKQKSDYETDIVLTKNDVVLTLSTCTNSHNNNTRYVVHARLMNPEQYNMVYEYIY